MAQQYDWLELSTKLLNFEYCPIDQLVALEGFDRLGTDLPFKLALKRVPHAVENEAAQAIFKLFHHLHEPFKKEQNDADEIRKGIYEVCCHRGGDGDITKDGESGVCCPGNRGASDIEIMNKDGRTAMMRVHSVILDFYSEV